MRRKMRHSFCCFQPFVVLAVGLILIGSLWWTRYPASHWSHEDEEKTHHGGQNGGERGRKYGGRIRPMAGSMTSLKYTSDQLERFRELVRVHADFRDPDVLEFIRDVVDAPVLDGSEVKLSQRPRETPQSMEVEKILHEKRGGFFVECGAFDGERSSNTLYLEMERGWTGLLVEPDPHYYTQLLGKNRRVWSLNACLSPYTYVTDLPFEPDNGVEGHVKFPPESARRFNFPVSDEDMNRQVLADGSSHVPCFPLESILRAINRTHVDYFSLDVEGLELEVLKTIHFQRLSVEVISVEYSREISDAKDQMLEHMHSAGYRQSADLQVTDVDNDLYVNDLIFVKENFIDPRPIGLKIPSTSTVAASQTVPAVRQKDV